MELVALHDGIVRIAVKRRAARLESIHVDGAWKRPAAAENAVPASDAAPALRQMRGDAFRKPGLQLILVAQAFRLYARLALLARLPRVAGAFVATDMHRLGRKHVAHEIENLAQKLDDLVVSGAIHVLLYAPDAARHPRGGSFGEARQLGICGDGRERMPGQLYLGYDLDVPLGGIAHDLAQVGFGVVERPVAACVHLHRTPVGRHVPVDARVVRRGFWADRSELDEFRIPRHVDAPSLILGQMPMEHIELVLRHLIEQPTHGVLAEEMPSLVEQQASPRVLGAVFDLAAGKRYCAVAPIARHNRQLFEGLAGVKRPGIIRTRHPDAVGRHRQAVAFRQYRRIGRTCHG